jgi:integrase
MTGVGTDGGGSRKASRRKAGWKAKREGNRLRVTFRVPGTKLGPQTMRFPLGTGNWEINAHIRKQIEKLQWQHGVSAGGTFASDLECYLLLPRVQGLATRAEQGMHLRTLSQLVGHMNRLAISKRQWELILGGMQRDRKWEPATFNKWLSTIKSLYRALDDPNETLPNPVGKIEYQQEPDPLPRALDLDVADRILARLEQPSPTRNRISFSAEQRARAMAAEGVSNVAIAGELGVSETAIRKMLARTPQEKARESERARLALRVIAAIGLRQGQVMKLRPEHFEPQNKRVFVTQSGKGDRSFWKPLDMSGLAAMQAFADASAWGKFDLPNSRRLWKSACKAEGLREPLPRPYDLRHSYMTEMLLACGSLEALQTISGHAGTRTLRRYTKAAEDEIARRAADAFGERLAAKRAERDQKANENNNSGATTPSPAAEDVVSLLSEANPSRKNPNLRLVASR